MTKISRDDVLKLAKLSSLQLSNDEIDALGGDIEAILQYVKQLDELDTEGVEPAYQVTGLSNVSRDDSVETHPLSTDSLLSIAPERASTYVKVPKVL